MKSDPESERRGGLTVASPLLVWGCAAAAIMLAAGRAAAADPPPRPTLEMVTGEQVAKDGLTEIGNGSIRFADDSAFPLDQVRLIRFQSASSPAADEQAIVHLSGGGRLPVQEVLLLDEACQVTLADGRKASLSLDDVAGVQWSQSSDQAWRDALSGPPEEYDLVVLKAAPEATSIRAFIEAIRAESIEFDWDRETRTLQTNQLVGVVFAKADKPAGHKLLIRSIAGAVIPANVLKTSHPGGMVICTLPQGGRLEVHQNELASITIGSSRLMPLSALVPARVVERPIVALPRGWKADRNVRGEPLRAASEIFEQGIGVQAGTSLTYELDGRAEQFAAVLALDSPPGMAGDCEFVVLADGEELIRRHLTSSDGPAAVRVPLNGARRLELRVDYGSNLDFGDHANWCDAHLVLAPRTTNDDD